jgi:hypothetical protein
MAHMNHTVSDNLSTIEAVQEQFRTWRSNRVNKREPIPDHLWKAAAELCQAHPISHICRELRLSFADLKRHIRKEQTPAIQFMEIDMNSLSGRWQIECSRADGSQLRVAADNHALQIETIIRAFLA